MKPVKFATLVAAVSLSAIGSAQAAVLYTAPYGFNHSLNGHFHCGILNISKKAADVTVDVMDSSGAVVDTTGVINLAPGATTNLNGGANSADHCRFTVKGSAKSYRAGFFQEDGNGFLTVFVPAS